MLMMESSSIIERCCKNGGCVISNGGVLSIAPLRLVMLGNTCVQVSGGAPIVGTGFALNECEFIGPLHYEFELCSMGGGG